MPPPAVGSCIVAAARRTGVHGPRIVEFQPRQCASDGTAVSRLRFPLRDEPVDLGVLVAALKAINPAVFETWVRAEPSGAYSQHAWFFYETVTGQTLDLTDVRTGNYVDPMSCSCPMKSRAAQ